MRFLLFLLFVAGALFATNPGSEAHRDALEEEVRLHLRNTELPGGKLGQAFAGFALEAGIVDAIIANQFIYEDWLLFSVGHLGEKRGVTIGVLGKVITGGQIQRWEEASESASNAQTVASPADEIPAGNLNQIAVPADEFGTPPTEVIQTLESPTEP